MSDFSDGDTGGVRLPCAPLPDPPLMWLESVISPKIAWADGRTIEPFVPFEVVRPIRFGPRGSGADIEWPASNNLKVTIEPTGLVFDDDATGRTRSGALLKIIASRVPPGGLWWRPPLMLRVLEDPQDSAGWPVGLAAPPAPWSDETLSVLGDELLERGLTVGRRFTERTLQDDERWVPAFTLRHQTQLSWRRGVLETATEIAQGGGLEFGRALALQAVCKPLRRLDLICYPPADVTEVVRGLIHGGGLPCLEGLGFSVVSPDPKAIQRALALLPGFGAAFPAIKTVEVVRRPLPMPVVG